MATIDPFLRAASRSQMEALLLEPGRTPRVRRAGREQDIHPAVLEGPRIAVLIAEVAPGGASPSPAAGQFEFAYQLEGAYYRFQGTATPAGWRVEVELPRMTDTGSRPALQVEPAGTAAPPITSPSVVTGATPIESIAELLLRLLDQRGSDLHLSSALRPRMRVDGDLVELVDVEAPSSQQLEKLLFEITPERNRTQFQETSDTDFAYEIPGMARFRVNLYRDQRGVASALRVIPQQIPSLDDLGLPDSVHKLAFLTKGLVLVTGPTGSGKSTTLAAILDLVNRSRSDHILTIEDPIEFVHPSKKCLVNQREVGVHTESFKRALRAALREDPDVVLVGEMRDLETVAIALETAETGHLVLGTLHTSTAPSTIERLVDQFPGDRQGQVRLMLADSLRAVIAQTLLKRIGGGRVAAHEVLMTTPAVSNLIREGKTFQIFSAMQTGKAQGMRLLNDALLDLVERKIVEPREAYLKAIDKEGLLGKLRAAGARLDFLGDSASGPS
ncbi:MAG TPA: type IV pilus twitching motility protein PilT [Thermoanaerobaculia bacterium]|nr:type IV pilus twitching motility protein PilT [Thermoanaerobaculia bacterium]